MKKSTVLKDLTNSSSNQKSKKHPTQKKHNQTKSTNPKKRRKKNKSSSSKKKTTTTKTATTTNVNDDHIKTIFNTLKQSHFINFDVPEGQKKFEEWLRKQPTLKNLIKKLDEFDIANGYAVGTTLKLGSYVHQNFDYSFNERCDIKIWHYPPNSNHDHETKSSFQLNSGQNSFMNPCINAFFKVIPLLLLASGLVTLEQIENDFKRLVFFDSIPITFSSRFFSKGNELPKEFVDIVATWRKLIVKVLFMIQSKRGEQLLIDTVGNDAKNFVDNLKLKVSSFKINHTTHPMFFLCGGQSEEKAVEVFLRKLEKHCWLNDREVSKIISTLIYFHSKKVCISLLFFHRWNGKRSIS
ncbi:MAG TPA: hypothetical protein VMW74_01340 [Nitrosopumilaceae archaeon]|nr:hypothetical protein [Nitrosopumilaceae archaeon]